MDVIDHTDYPGNDVPHAAKLLARRIAVANGPTGPYLVRANSVLVETTDDDHLARLQQFAGHIGCQVRRDTDHESCTTNRHATIEFEPRSLRPDFGAAPQRAAAVVDPSTGRGPEPKLRPVRVPRWSVQGIVDTGRALVDGGFDAKPNHVYMGNPVYTGNPGVYLANPSGSSSNATSAMPASGPIALRDEIVLGDRPRPTVLVLDTGLSTTSDGSTVWAQHDLLRGDRLILREPWRNDPTGVVDDEDEPDDDPSTSDGIGIVDRAAGHGTFIAGIVRRLCPEATIYVEGVLSSFGDGDDDTVGQGIEHATPSARPPVRRDHHEPRVLHGRRRTAAVGRHDRRQRRARDGRRRLGRQRGVGAPAVPGGAPERRQRRRARSDRASLVLQLWPVGGRVRAGGRGAEHLSVPAGDQRPTADVQRVRPMEWHELRRTQGGGGHRPGDVHESDPG